MRSKNSPARRCISVVLFLFVIALAPSALAAPPSDACSLLTKAEVSAAVGVPVAEGSHMTPTYLKSCTWSPAGGSAKGLRTVVLSLDPAESFAMAKSMLQAVVNSPRNKGSITMTPAPGIGDDAYYSSTGSYSKLIVKKRDAAFQVVVYSDAPIGKKQAMEKALAFQVLSKL